MLKLLVVDDNNRDRRVAREMSIWQDLNIQVIGEAANGHLALEQIEHLGVPDIVLTDVSMPYMDGMTLSKKLQQEYPRVHVLFMSYYEEFEYARNAISVHADAYIVKPLREKEVRALKQLKRHFYESFERLHVDHVDLYLLHDAEAYGVMEQEALPFLLERQKEGMIDYIGQGTRDVNAHQHAVAGGVMDGVLSYLQFCLIQTAAREAALEAKKAGVAFINGSPLAAGIFIAPQEVPAIRNYTRTQEDMRFAAEMRVLLEKEAIDPVAAALQYPLLFDEIDMTLTGTSSAEELQSTLNGLHAVIYPEQWARIFRLQESYRFFRLQPEYAKNRE